MGNSFWDGNHTRPVNRQASRDTGVPYESEHGRNSNTNRSHYKKGTNESQSNSSGCFIATECYESSLHPDVVLLKTFRDECLLKLKFGEILIKTYYRISPTIANYLSTKPIFKPLVLNFIIKPITGVIKANIIR